MIMQFVPSEPVGPLEDYTVRRWRDIVGLSSHLQEEVRLPPPPSLQHVILDLLYMPYGRRVHLGDAFASARGWDVRVLLAQIFSVEGSQSDFSGVILRLETFPLRLRCDLIQSLDLAIGNDLFGLVPEMCQAMGGTLTQLMLRFRE